MSPLSDTTNLAPAMAGTELFTHIRYMMLTTVPTMVITLLIFLFMGFNLGQADDLQDVGPILDAISGVFDINLWLFIVPLIVIWLIVKRVPAIPALLAGTLLGGLFAIIFQPDVIRTIAGNDLSVILANYVAVLKAMYGTVAITTGNAVVDELLATSGMSGMLNTIWLILSAMIFGGVMDACGMLKRITKSIIHLAHSTGSLVASTAVSCIFFNLTASDQYLAIVVPGKMFEKIYRQRGLAPQNLSRTLEDSGTVTSVLVPWNTCGATQSRILGVATLEYIPYCFFNIISPIMTVFFAYAGLKIAKLIPQKTETDNN
jgi:NhaC family Na+:H+ antiporter